MQWTIDDELLNLVDIVIVKLAKIVSRKFLEDTKSEHATVKTIYDIKDQSQPLSFLMSGQRCRSVIECLVAFSGVYMKSNLFEIQSLSSLKIKNLCLTYESLMVVANLNVNTAPSIARNLKLLKTVHSKVL